MLKNQEGTLRWYGLKEVQLKNEYKDNCIIIKILDFYTNFDNWDIKIKKSYLIISKTSAYFIDNDQDINSISLDKIRIYKDGKRIMFKHFSSIIEKYFSTSFSLDEVEKILNKSFLDLKKNFKISEKEFYIAYFIQCEPI